MLQSLAGSSCVRLVERHRSAWCFAFLVLGYLLYLVFGAVVFSSVELPYEDLLRQELRKVKRRFLEEHECLAEPQLEQFLARVLEASNYGVSVLSNTSGNWNWDFTSALFFASTVLSTTGKGAAPRQGEGLPCPGPPPLLLHHPSPPLPSPRGKGTLLHPPAQDWIGSFWWCGEADPHRGYSEHCVFNPLLGYLLLGLIAMLVVLETFCELHELKKFRKMFYVKKDKEEDQVHIMEHDQLSFSSISDQAASMKEDKKVNEPFVTIQSAAHCDGCINN
uniref:Potassium two pore domain channel subfamily K member 1 n=1 Tax=Sphenodon punctatus TaxID=8508 RepID=A0A8D0HPT9_SPHPU